MKRIGLIATLFAISLLFTQCKDECPECGCGGGIFIEEAIGLLSTSTQFEGDSLSPRIIIFPEFLFAQSHKESFSFITSAYACQASPVVTTFDNLVDSIQVESDPKYRDDRLASILEFEVSYNENATLGDYNEGLEREFSFTNLNPQYLFLTEKPTQSDSFTFSFYYYKDGAIIDSSFTQKFYISNE